MRRLLLATTLSLAAPAASAARAAPLEAVGPVSAGMVSAADPRAAAAGREMLRAGGSAVDAAIATMLALTVVEPQSSGIGGGSFLVYSDARTGLASYDGREAAPAAATPRYFYAADGTPLGHADAVPGGKSVGVPGDLRAWGMAHAEHGRLPWARLFAPAIRLARDGYAISPRLDLFLGSSAAHVTGGWARRQFWQADGTTPKPAGTMLRNPDLARVLGRIARHGPDWLYTGSPAATLVRAVRAAPRNPSPMTAGDLASYDAKRRPVLCGVYRGYRICGMGPPSSGAIAVFAILKQLERFDLAGLGRDNPRAWHLIAESMRLAYADRDLYLGDPDHVPVPVAGLMDPAYLARRGALISPDRAMAHVAAGSPPGAPPRVPATVTEVPSTTHIVAVDAQGDAASVTSTIEGPFGSGLTVDGFFLNNELTDFDIVPEKDGALVANRVEGGKRPRSSMSPTIVFEPDGRLRVAIGAAGGATIIAQVAKALIAIIDWHLPAEQAIALPQLMGYQDSVMIEQGSALEAMAPALAAMGHAVVGAEMPLKANAIERIGEAWHGAADPRSEGAALAQ